MASAIENVGEFVWEVAKIVILALAIVIPVRHFLFQPFVIEGSSMEPNFYEADYLIVDELSYRLREPARGEVIVFDFPRDTSKRFIKRVIGLPGETVEIKGGQVIITGADGTPKVLSESYIPADLKAPDMPATILGAGQYFVLGDNRPASYDSQDWGELPEKNIVGRVELRLWPLNAITRIQTPAY
jgi:signal peptidase I